MDDLIAFIGARLDEDEAAAKAAAEATGCPIWGIAGNISARASRTIVTSGHIEVGSEAEALHIAEWNPARVLREVEAKRAIVLVASKVLGDGRLFVLGQLATAWSDHPDYRDEWKP